MHTRGLVIASMAFLGVGAAPAADMDAVNEAVRRGADYLRRMSAPAQGYSGDEHGTGTAALAGLAMLEAGVPRQDPALQNILQFIRTHGLMENKTYRVALCLIFLDKFGDRRDVPLIQVLGIRLYAGLNGNAGWTYDTFPAVPPAEAARLAQVLAEPAPDGKLHPEAVRMYQAVRLSIRLGRAVSYADDNSNTQFGLIGLWVASRHHVPVGDAIAAIERRFLASQNRLDGGWGYHLADSRSTTSMTCAGLLGLAAGAALRESIKTGKPLGGVAKPEDFDPEPDKKEQAKPPVPDAFAKPRQKVAGPADPGKAEKPAEPEPEPKAESEVDPKVRTAAIDAALTSVGHVIANVHLGGGGAAQGGGVLANFIGHGNLYYLLWSVERVGVIFGLETIGDVNWFDWGAAYLLPAQGSDGSWSDTRYGAVVNTSFAILFLCKSNLVAEISGRLKGKHKDPARTELRGGGGAGPPPLIAPAAPEPTVPPPAEPVIRIADVLPEVKDTSESIKLAETLIAASDEDWPDRLVELRDSRGGIYTLALARAITGLEGVRRKQARDTLSDRFVRMTPKALRGLLRDEDAEVRRAAALAVAVKGERSLIPDLIDRLADPSDQVARAARAALRHLTERDFGPEPGAEAAGRLKAAQEWRAWYDANRPRAE